MQEVERVYKLPVASILKLDDLIAHLEASGARDAAMLDKIRQYRIDYGIR